MASFIFWIIYVCNNVNSELPSSTVESSWVTLIDNRSILAWRLELLKFGRKKISFNVCKTTGRKNRWTNLAAIDSAALNRFPKISSACLDNEDSWRIILDNVPLVTPSSSSGTWNSIQRKFEMHHGLFNVKFSPNKTSGGELQSYSLFHTRHTFVNFNHMSCHLKIWQNITENFH